ncbi:hypothetical protein ZIOFF_041900 [Zingiber officinale]|uniref:R13L1/DRL21-like LRR repeat region domain-containing protein n=1 Tax=Zingiber officinale TaxID=94328 RepID=A0A8J5KWI7_ZINOF|nr:hypothetical protein ZIOFF_041900 [Zingiber officinale]
MTAEPTSSVLEELFIDGISNLTNLPDWLQHLKSLHSLSIGNCSRLERVPRNLKNLHMLKTLNIADCPLLESRCERETGLRPLIPSRSAQIDSPSSSTATLKPVFLSSTPSQPTTSPPANRCRPHPLGRPLHTRCHPDIPLLSRRWIRLRLTLIDLGEGFSPLQPSPRSALASADHQIHCSNNEGVDGFSPCQSGVSGARHQETPDNEYPLLPLFPQIGRATKRRQIVTVDNKKWFAKRVDRTNERIDDLTLRALARGPNPVAFIYHGFNVNGFAFRTVESEGNKKVQNSGVMVSSMHDNDDNESTYYGRLTDIISLDYNGHGRIVLFRCDWVNTTVDDVNTVDIELIRTDVEGSIVDGMPIVNNETDENLD